MKRMSGQVTIKNLGYVFSPAFEYRHIQKDDCLRRGLTGGLPPLGDSDDICDWASCWLRSIDALGSGHTSQCPSYVVIPGWRVGPGGIEHWFNPILFLS